jgi:hypothetical protein
VAPATDTRRCAAFEVVDALREQGKGRVLAVLGSHRVPAGELSRTLRARWGDVVDLVRFEPERIVTGCAPAGTEKAARLLAPRVTSGRAVVFHRAEVTYGRKGGEEMRDVLLAQEATSLLLVTTGAPVCRHARERFGARMKRVYEIEIG